MSSQLANNFRLLLANGSINFGSDTFKIILMAEGFTFNPDSHDLYSDVSASELSAGVGYTTGGNTLAGVTLTQNDTADRVYVTWSNTSWTASGGDIGPVCGAIILDDTVANDPVVGFIDFGGSFTEPDGGTATIANITVTI